MAGLGRRWAPRAGRGAPGAGRGRGRGPATRCGPRAPPGPPPIRGPQAGPPFAPAIDAAGQAGVPVVILDNVVDQAKYVVNVWSQNNSPAAAGVAGLVRNGNVLMVRGIAGNPVEQAFQDAAVADVG